MSYIYSDLKRSARLTLAWMYSPPIYPGILTNTGGWYIDARSSPKDFWALMSVAHPDLCSRHKIIRKSNIQRAIALIFEHVEQLKVFNEMLINKTMTEPFFLHWQDHWEVKTVTESEPETTPLESD